MKNVLIKFQLPVLIIGIAIFLLSFISSYFITTNCLPFNPNFSQEQIKNCNTPFCNVLKKITTLKNEKFPAIELSKQIFISNIKATVNEITAYRYYGFAPVLNVFQTATLFGYHARCNLNSWFLRLLFPSGWLELIAILLFFSLFYSAIINVVLFLFKSNHVNKQTINKFILQIVIITTLYFVGSILESISYLYWR